MSLLSAEFLDLRLVQSLKPIQSCGKENYIEGVHGYVPDGVLVARPGASAEIPTLVGAVGIYLLRGRELPDLDDSLGARRKDEILAIVFRLVTCNSEERSRVN